MVWIIWILTTTAVVAAKYYAAKTITKMRRELAETEKRLSKAKMADKVAESYLAVASKDLADTQKTIALHKKNMEQLNQELRALEEEEEREMQESRNKLSR